MAPDSDFTPGTSRVLPAGASGLGKAGGLGLGLGGGSMAAGLGLLLPLSAADGEPGGGPSNPFAATASRIPGVFVVGTVLPGSEASTGGGGGYTDRKKVGKSSRTG